MRTETPTKDDLVLLLKEALPLLRTYMGVRTYYPNRESYAPNLDEVITKIERIVEPTRPTPFERREAANARTRLRRKVK